MQPSEPTLTMQRLALRALLRSGATAFALIWLASCTTASIEDAVPAPVAQLPAPAAPAQPAAGGLADAPVETVAAPVAGLPAGAPLNTGTYPNLNVPPQVANEQLSDADKASNIESLSAARQRQGARSGGGAGADAALLRKLAAKHAAEALEKIEKTQ